jgi:putative nucleotidyltransferase with HDIG domain
VRQALVSAVVKKKPRVRRETPTINEIVKDRQRGKVSLQIHRIILERIGQNRLVVPAMPQITLETIALLRDTNVTFTAIAKSLERDPIVAPQIVRRANSAIYGGGSRAKTLENAVSRLGLQELRNTLVTLTAHKVFDSRSPRIRKAFKGLWEHSLAVAILGRDLVAALHVRQSGDATYLAGLLHDVGKPIVGAMLLEAEKLLGGADGWLSDEAWLENVNDSHRSVGVAVSERWELPDEVSEAIVAVESYDGADPHCIANIVGFANALAKSIGFVTGTVDQAAVERVFEEGCALLRVDSDTITEITANLSERVRA